MESNEYEQVPNLDASERLPFDPNLDESGQPLPEPIGIVPDVEEISDPTERIMAPTATLRILRKSFDHRSSPSHTLIDIQYDEFRDMEEIIIEHSTIEKIRSSRVLIDALADVRENYRLVIPTTSTRELLARLILSYANYIQTVWGPDQGDPIAYIYYHYFSSSTSPDDVLRQYINVAADSFLNEFINRSLEFQSESENVENLYNDIVDAYNTIADGYMPFEEADIEALGEDELDFIRRLIGTDSVTPEEILSAIDRGLNVVNSDPIHTDFKIAGDLSFKESQIEEDLAGPELASLVEYSRIIEDPVVDTVSAHVLLSNYPHLGHITKYISPTSNGMYMFDFMETSISMPLIVFTDGTGRRFYKVFENSAEHTRLYTRLLMKNTRTYDELIIEKPDYKSEAVGRGDARVAVRKEIYEEDFDTIQMIYLQDLNDQRSAVNIILNVRDGTFQSMLDANYSGEIESPYLEFSNLQPVQYSGYFNIYDVPFNDIAFNDLVVTDPSISQLVSISEVTNLSVDKIHQSYLYRAPTREQLNRIGLGTLTVPEVRFTVTSTLNNDANMAPLGVTKITISYEEVDTEEQLNAFIEFMKMLMVYIANKTPEVLEFYSEYVDVSVPVQMMDNRQKLAAMNPELFGRSSGYTTVCSSAIQPTYIDMEDPNDFENKVTNNPVIVSGVQRPRTYLTYPRGDNEVTVTCLHDDAPYVSLKLNRRYPENALFEYVPCCVKQPRHAGHQLAMRYQQTGQLVTVDTPIDELINARILRPGMRSILEYTNIIYITNDYLNIPRPVDTRIVPIRVGIQKSNRSLLEACNWALYGSNQEVSMTDVIEMIDNRILNLSVCKQECYDMTIEDMYRYLSDPSKVIDSKRFYRLFEELFNINIWVFEVESNMEFQVPRHRRYHVRANRDRINVLIIENVVAGVPQYEPIMYHVENEEGELNLLSTTLDEEHSDDIYRMYKMTNRTLDDQFNEVADPILLTHDLEVRSQILDQYGRLVGLVYPNLSMIIQPPNQPMNLPIANGEDLPKLNLDQVDIAYDTISIEFEGDTDQVLRQGVWYHQGGESYFFPVNDDYILPDIDVVTYPNMTAIYDRELIDFKNSYRENRMKLSTVLQLIMMLLDQYYPDAQYVPDGIFEYAPDGFEYDVSRVPQILPIDITWEYAESICNFIRASPIPTIVVSRDLEDGFYYYLDRRLRLNLKQGNVIRDRYEFLIPDKSQLKFSSELDFVEWLQSLQYDVPIVDTVQSGNYASLYPYIYRYNGQYYLIQPVYSRDSSAELRATFVSRTWKNERVNLGYFVSVDNVEPIEAVASQITNNRIDNLDADYLIRHDRYFAILPVSAIR